ncbi:hypothetical protein EMIHUDRAFT_452262 [Emiliania huxleyi CCMP1516]|uniref:NIF system FeS cluster assembly NifU C-terminal domain-containing protein n=3 Tax=Emiliania huxleyi TaxID=2903 RepID=A0A0D3ILH3_EMIH1|nr:hypothetical protein EMIHUDRAFT_452262 [Emiliania huxleyi CCMP1516]EOD12108.1 hypothetical protein EMIHUDRAFT_452262 [Emiliania huxleyi CCMP1516]|eukprot:XP_005764537.1 hypothetical protein EMIHUDRAFT_452262 [Emiliania huxleyi CCMP1516]
MASCGGRARCLLLLSSWLHSAGSLRVPAVSAVPRVQHRAGAPRCSDPVTSPFEASASNGGETLTGPLPLTAENVDAVLDEMRPYLMADGGNVAVAEIDGGVVRLELQGACGSCASSAMTMKMGLERGLREKIPEIIAVEQVAPDGPQLTEDGIEGVLEEIRPFLKMAGGDVELVELIETGVAPSCTLRISGSGSTINSVRAEIAQRLKRNFPSLANVMWDAEGP